MIMSKETLIKSIREVPDFPIPGILFYDVTTLFKDPWCLQELSNIMFDNPARKWKLFFNRIKQFPCFNCAKQ